MRVAGLGLLAAIAEEHFGNQVRGVAELLGFGSLIREYFACNLSLMGLRHDSNPWLHIRLSHRIGCDLLVVITAEAA